MQAINNYDVVVIGGGPGGYVAAIRAAQLGAKVAIVEKDRFGGTCLNRGCIPTKYFIRNADIIHGINQASKRGIQADLTHIDMKKMVQIKDDIVSGLVRGVEGLLKSNQIAVYRGEGYVNNKTVTVRTGEEDIRIAYDKLIIATGSSNLKPTIPGLDENVLTSTELLNIEEIPKRLVIVGGGVIGCEFATIFNEFGTEVTIVEKLSRLVPNMDFDLSDQLKKTFEKKGIHVLTTHSVERVQHSDSGYLIQIVNEIDNSGIDLSADKLLISVGRNPNLVGIEDLGLEYNGKYVLVNKNMETSIKGIYAIGDINGLTQLAHVASAQGMVAAEHAFGEEITMSLGVVPSCIYTIPEIASIGITEAQARSNGNDIKVGLFPVAALGKAQATGDTEGFYKIIADNKTNKVLGVHIFGKGATEIIAEASAIMASNGTLEMITNTIHAHPTMAEGLMEAAHAADGLCIHLPKRR